MRPVFIGQVYDTRKKGDFERGVADEHVRKANNESFCAKDYESATKEKMQILHLMLTKVQKLH